MSSADIVRWRRAGEALAHIGRFFHPGYRTGRRIFCREAAGLLLFLVLFRAAAGWLEGALWIPDDWIVAMAPWASAILDLWMVAFMAVCARRLHDAGVSGAWAFWLTMPILQVALVGYCALMPSAGADNGFEEYESALR